MRIARTSDPRCRRFGDPRRAGTTRCRSRCADVRGCAGVSYTLTSGILTDAAQPFDHIRGVRCISQAIRRREIPTTSYITVVCC